MSSERAAKRSEYRRDTEFYFDNGDIVLSAKVENYDDTADWIVYRVDKIVLSRHSPVFAGMFNLPAIPGVNEEYDGVPMVILDEDRRTVGNMLCFMYRPDALYVGQHSGGPSMMALMKLADKYEFEGIKRLIAQQLEQDWPTDWSSWVRKEADIDHIKRMNDFRNPEEAFLVDSIFPEPASAVRIALDHDIPDILPAALYCLAQIDIQDDWDRHHRGRFKFWTGGLPPAWPGPAEEGRRTARWSLLDKDTMHSVLWARGALSERVFQLLSFFEAHGRMKPRCGRGTCGDSIKRLVDVYMLVPGKPRGEDPNPLRKLMEIHTLIGSTNFCYICQAHLRSEVENEMATVWDELQQIFCIEQLRSGKWP